MPEYSYDFDLNSDMEKELDTTYNELEVIVERLKRLRESLAGFTDIVLVYTDLYKNLVAPLKYIIPPDFAFIVKFALSSLGVVFMMWIFLPLVSGFARLPWNETMGIVFAFLGMWAINILKQRLGVATI